MRVSQSRLLATTEAVDASAPAAPSATPSETKTKREAEDVGEGVRQDATAADPFDAAGRGSRQVRQEDRHQRQDTGRRDGEHTRQKGRNKGDFDTHAATVPSPSGCCN